jgi:hypothetical protein
MFYKSIKLPEQDIDKDFFLINNFLEKCPEIVKKITMELSMMSIEVTNDEMDLNIEKIIDSTFELLVNSKREFKIESITNPKILYKKIFENGLTSESLIAKLKILDWLWEKSQEFFNDLRGGMYYNLFHALINQIKSLLKSILNALGFPTDIFEEALDLLNSFLPICNNDFK